MIDARYLRRIYWRLAGVTMLAVVLALAAISYFSHQAFQRELVPETARKAFTVGASVRSLLLKAMDYGIPYESLHAVDKTFAEVVEDNPEFDYMAAADARGKLVFEGAKTPQGMRDYVMRPDVMGLDDRTAASRGAERVGGLFMVSVPVDRAGVRVGMLHIGIDAAFVDKILLEVLLDVVVVLVVSLFFTIELLHFMAGARLETGLATLSRLAERVRNGDFTMRARDASRDEIGRIVRKLDGAIGALNKGWQGLSRELQDRVRIEGGPDKPRVRAAQTAWEEMKAKFHFGGHTETTIAADASGLNRVRAPLFAFILAEELTRSFLPSYVNQLLVPIPGLSPQVVIGLPIMLFMLIVALGQPYLGAWSERVGRRRAMLVGAAVATVGFVATALASSLYDLLAWRSLCAVGYAMVFVAAQGFVLDHTGTRNRAQGFALFIGAIMVATVCGPSIGGILADNIGIRPTFVVSAVLAFISILAIRLLPDDDRAQRTATTKAPSLKQVFELVFNRNFMVLTGLAAMPAKIILTGVCFYLVPLYIVSIGNTQAMAGRMLMVYAVMMVLIVPVAAGFSDLGARRQRLVASGLVISGLGGFLLLASQNFLMIFGVVFLLGLGQSLSIAAQSALVGEHCQEEIARYGHDAVYGVYRLLERLGNALGPLAASLLVVFYGYPGAFVALSGFVLVCGLVFALFTWGRSPSLAPAT